MLNSRKQINSNEVASQNISIKEQKRSRALREEEFLHKFWQLITPMQNQNELIPNDCSSIRVMTDFLKLIYDPYISGLSLNTEAFNQKVQLTVEYIKEVRRLVGA